MPAIPGLASLAGSLPGSVRVPGRTPTGLGVAERAGARGTSEIQIAGCARRCFRAEIEGRGFDSPHLHSAECLSERFRTKSVVQHHFSYAIGRTPYRARDMVRGMSDPKTVLLP